MSEVTRILCAMQQGEPQLAEQLLPLVYDELRLLAAQRMARGGENQTLQATALVHEAYLRLVDGSAALQWNGRGHFFGAAAEAMRRILVDRARGKQRVKRGAGVRRQALQDDLPIVNDENEMLAVHEALDELASHDAQAAALVKLRYFAGLSHQESAEVLGLSRRAADRLWLLARMWLFRTLSDK